LQKNFETEKKSKRGKDLKKKLRQKIGDKSKRLNTLKVNRNRLGVEKRTEKNFERKNEKKK